MKHKYTITQSFIVYLCSLGLCTTSPSLSSVTVAGVQNDCPFSFTQVWNLYRHSSIASSTMLCDKLFHVSIKRCLRSVPSQTGVWYTLSCIMPLFDSQQA